MLPSASIDIAVAECFITALVLHTFHKRSSQRYTSFEQQHPFWFDYL